MALHAKKQRNDDRTVQTARRRLIMLDLFGWDVGMSTAAGAILLVAALVIGGVTQRVSDSRGARDVRYHRDHRRDPGVPLAARCGRRVSRRVPRERGVWLAEHVGPGVRG